MIDRFGIEEAVPITAFKTFQVKIAEVERLTGLTFTAGTNPHVSLSTFDPLETRPPRRGGPRRRGPFDEATLIDVPADYVPLDSLESIVR